MFLRLRSRSLIIFLLLLFLIFSLAIASAYARPDKDVQRTITGLDFIGEVNFPTGYDFAGTEVGGLSGITRDANRGAYYSLSDDQGTIDPVRYYTLEIDVSDGVLEDGDIVFTDVTFLKDQNGELLVPGSLDPEGIFLPRPGQLYITSEGNTLTDPKIDPFVNRFNPVGKQNRELPVPDKFLPDEAGTKGVRFNLAFESLTATPDRRSLFTAGEGALVQDGPAADVGQESFARILEYSLGNKQPMSEYVYVVDPVAEVPDPSGAFRVNGLVELVALDNAGTFLAMERSFSVGKGNTVLLYEIRTQEATDVSGYEALVSNGSTVPFTPVTKRLLLDFGDLFDQGLIAPVDNLEGLAFGPPLEDSRLPLIVVSDNNFSPGQVTQFVALAVTLETLN